MNNEKKFIFLMSFLLGIFSIFYLGINFIFTGKNVSATHIFIIIFNVIFLFFIITIVFSMIISYFVLNEKKVNKNIMNLNFKIVSILYPFMINASKVLKISKNDIRKVYVYLNNKYILSIKHNIKPEDIMILTPHCIQKSFCKHKVTNDIENCARCGKCNVNDLVKLKEKYNVKVYIATGGTLARKIIIKYKPKAIIAVACERDLTSGIQDVSKIPVVGVFNKRPNGPCFDTQMDILEVEKVISFFLGGN